MNNYVIKAGTIDVSVVIRIIDSADGTPETAVVFNTAGIDMQYRRELAASTSITEATQTIAAAHADGGFIHIGNGYYRLDLPDAACAAGSVGVLVHGVVTGMVVIGAYIQLVAYDPFDTVRLGLTAMPNVASGAAGAIVTSGTGTAQLTTTSGQVTVGSTAAGAITATSIATGAVDADALAADAVTEIAAGISVPSAATVAAAVWNEDATAHQTAGTFGQAIGDPGADTNTIYKAVVTDATAATVGLDVVAVKAETASIQADTNDIQTRIPTTLTAGRINANVGAIENDVITDAAVAADVTIASVTGSVGSVTGNVGGNVTGSVGSVTGNVGGNVNGSVASVTTVNDKTGYRLSGAGVDDILDEPITEPSAMFGWGGANLRTIVGVVGAMVRNKRTQTATTQTLRNDADSGSIATSATSDDGTTTTRAEWA